MDAAAKFEGENSLLGEEDYMLFLLKVWVWIYIVLNIPFSLTMFSKIIPYFWRNSCLFCQIYQ